MTEAFILYSTLGCHLCETAKAICAPVLAEEGQALLEKDIANSANLMEEYGVRIPVVRHEETGAELGWPFSEAELRHWLAGLPKG